MTQHPLQPHVLWFARSLHLAGVVVIEHAVGEARDGHRGVHPFPDEDEVAVTVLPDGRQATIADQQRGYRDDGADEPDRQSSSHHQPGTTPRRDAHSA
jgi:hypothetical protein